MGTVRISAQPEISIKLPTLAGLALMKIISWNEKYPERQKDAEDLRLIIHMIGGSARIDHKFDEVLLFLEKLKKGLNGL